MPLRSFQLGRGPLANAAPAQIVVLTYPLVGNYGVPDASLIDAYGTFFPRQRPLRWSLLTSLVCRPPQECRVGQSPRRRPRGGHCDGR